jgi:hypothetical protein
MKGQMKTLEYISMNVGSKSHYRQSEHNVNIIHLS